jgi:hypothetical protein
MVYWHRRCCAVDSIQEKESLPDEKIELVDYEKIEIANNEEMLKVAKRILDEHRAAFEELAK